MPKWWVWVIAAGCANDPGTDTTGTPTGDTGTTVGGGVVKNLTWAVAEYAGSLVVASWKQTDPATMHIEFSVDEGVWESTPSYAFEAGDRTLVIAGIPYESTAEWRLVNDNTGESVTGKPITTAPWPAGLPRPSLVANDPTFQRPEDKYLLTSMNQFDGGWTGGAYWTIILDRQGRLIWAKRAPGQAWTLFSQVAVTGDRILWDEQVYWSNFIEEGLLSQVHSTWLDEEIEVIPTPGLHHAFIQLPDGSLVWGSQCHGTGESLVELAPQEFGALPGKDCPSDVGRVLWNCLEDWTASTSCESNGLFYQESTDSFLYSFYTNSAIVEIDHATGTSLWWAGDQPNGYRFIPEKAQYSWQHGISYTDTGTLLVSSEWGNVAIQTWLLEYEVDRKEGSLTMVWSDNSDVRAITNGQAWRLPNGNTLHIVGSASVIREVTPDHTDVWRLEYDDDYLLGHGQFIENLYDLVKPVETGSAVSSRRLPRP